MTDFPKQPPKLPGYHRPKTPEEMRARLLGSLILCPHCNTMQEVIGFGADVAGTNPYTGKPDVYIPIMLEDGGTARLWINTPDDT